MLLLRYDYAPNCVGCGSVHELKCFQVNDNEAFAPSYEAWYCKECVDKMEEDEENYRILE